MGADSDPLELDDGARIKTVELVVNDAKRSRTISVLPYLPDDATAEPAPAITFRHGRGGSRRGNQYNAKQWSKRRYVASFLQRPVAANNGHA